VLLFASRPEIDRVELNDRSTAIFDRLDRSTQLLATLSTQLDSGATLIYTLNWIKKQCTLSMPIKSTHHHRSHSPQATATDHHEGWSCANVSGAERSMSEQSWWTHLPSDMRSAAGPVPDWSWKGAVPCCAKYR